MHQLWRQGLLLDGLAPAILVFALEMLLELQGLLPDRGLGIAASTVVMGRRLVLVLGIKLLVLLRSLVFTALLLLANLPDPGKSGFRVSCRDGGGKLIVTLQSVESAISRPLDVHNSQARPTLSANTLLQLWQTISRIFLVFFRKPGWKTGVASSMWPK